LWDGVQHMTTQEGATERPRSARVKPSNFQQRVITSVVVAPVVIIATLLGGIPFAALILLGCTVGALEFYAMTARRIDRGFPLIGGAMTFLIALAFFVHVHALWIGTLIAGALIALIVALRLTNGDFTVSVQRAGITVLGAIYMGFPGGFLIAIRELPNGIMWLILVLFLTWGTDSFAYLGGRLFGRHKLAPVISPNKTVEGAIAGVTGGALVGVIVLAIGGQLSVAGVIMCMIAPMTGVIGDLLESWMKRNFGAKDSHLPHLNILPGHGGVLDRVDALVFVSTFCYLMIQVFQLA
jgi:phosphatidate cytidylyltransferase